VNLPLRARQVGSPWPRVRLGEIAEHRLGKMLDKAKNTGVPRRYLRNPNVRWFDLNLSELHEILVEEKDVHKYELQYGDVIICEGGEAGRAALWKDEAEGIIFQKACHRVRVGPKLDARFLIHRLMYDYFNGGLDDYYTGATIKHFTGQDLARYEIPLPPIAEQRRIAAILDKSDALRRKRKRALDLLNSLTQSIFLEMFGDERNSPFDIRVLDTITDKITDGAHFTPTYVESGVPFLRVTDIQDEAINWQAVKYIPQEEHDELVLRCRPEPGDVLLSKNGTIGIPRYVDWENIFSIFVSLCLIKPAKNILSGCYLTAYLKTGAAQRQLRQHSKTGTVTNLHLTEIRKMLIPLPPIEEQRKWEEMEVTLRSRSKRQLRAFINSEALFLSLQSRAFSGQL
jgi:type I restriction enzyme S subunit